MALRGIKRGDEYRKHRVMRGVGCVNTSDNYFYKNTKIPNPENDCMEWIGFKRSGYGRFRINGKQISAHRYSYSLFNSSISNNLIVLHKCDNRSCVNPSHLTLGTCADNNKDRDNKGRFTLLHSEENGNAKLNNQQVAQIKIRLNRGERGKDLAKIYNISAHTISKIKTGKLWRYV